MWSRFIKSRSNLCEIEDLVETHIFKLCLIRSVCDLPQHQQKMVRIHSNALLHPNPITLIRKPIPGLIFASGNGERMDEALGRNYRPCTVNHGTNHVATDAPVRQSDQLVSDEVEIRQPR